MLTQKSLYPKVRQSDQLWWQLDASDQVVGRLASEIASLLRGKHKMTFSPAVDCGDFVVVINAGKVRFTGNKWDQKKYYRHSGYVGGIKSRTARELHRLRPEMILANAVKGMLPKTSLGRKQLKKLKIYTGDTHPHKAQKVDDFRGLSG